MTQTKIQQMKNLQPPENRVEAILETLRLDHLNEEEKEHVIDIIKDYPGIFHLTGELLTPTHLVKHKIYTKDDVLVHTRPYRFSPSQKEEAQKVIDKMLYEGVIGPSNFPYSAPMLIIPKKIGSHSKKKI